MEIRIPVDKDKLNPKVKEAMEKVEEMTAPKERSPEYVRMMAQNRRKLTNINKDAARSPWEWSWGLDYLVQFLRFMRDYYKLGENVWGVEDKEWKKGVKYTRLETLEKTLAYYDKWQNLQDEYVKLEEVGKPKFEKNNDGTVTLVDTGYRCTYKYKTAKRTYKKLAKAEKKYKKLFFKMICEHIEEWWD